MKKIDTNFFNPKQQKLNWFNRNFYYAATIVMIALMVLSYFFFQDSLVKICEKSVGLSFLSLIFDPLCHSNVGHLIANCLSFFVVSLFLERHFGSIKYLLIIIFASSIASITNDIEWLIEGGLTLEQNPGMGVPSGASLMNFFLYGIFFTVIIFDFKPYLAQKWQPIFTIIILFVILAMICWNGDSSAIISNPKAFFKFGRFSALFNSDGTFNNHFYSMVPGFVIGLFANIFALGNNKRQDD